MKQAVIFDIFFCTSYTFLSVFFVEKDTVEKLAGFTIFSGAISQLSSEFALLKRTLREFSERDSWNAKNINLEIFSNSAFPSFGSSYYLIQKTFLLQLPWGELDPEFDNEVACFKNVFAVSSSGAMYSLYAQIHVQLTCHPPHHI